MYTANEQSLQPEQFFGLITEAFSYVPASLGERLKEDNFNTTINMHTDSSPLAGSSTVIDPEMLELFAQDAFSKLGLGITFSNKQGGQPGDFDDSQDKDESDNNPIITWKDYEKTANLITTATAQLNSLDGNQKLALSKLVILLSGGFEKETYASSFNETELQRISASVGQITSVLDKFGLSDEESLRPFRMLQTAFDEGLFNIYLRALNTGLVYALPNSSAVVELSRDEDKYAYAQRWHDYLGIIIDGESDYRELQPDVVINSLDDYGNYKKSQLVEGLEENLFGLVGRTYFYIYQIEQDDTNSSLIISAQYIADCKRIVKENAVFLGLDLIDENLEPTRQLIAIMKLADATKLSSNSLSELAGIIESQHQHDTSGTSSAPLAAADDFDTVFDKLSDLRRQINITPGAEQQLSPFQELIAFREEIVRQSWSNFITDNKKVLESMGISIELIGDSQTQTVTETQAFGSLNFLPVKLAIIDSKLFNDFTVNAKAMDLRNENLNGFNSLALLLATGIMQGERYEDPAKTFDELREVFDKIYGPMARLMKSFHTGFTPLSCFCQADQEIELPVLYGLAETKLFLHDPMTGDRLNLGPNSWHVSGSPDLTRQLWQKTYDLVSNMLASEEYSPEQKQYLKDRLSGNNGDDRFLITAYLYTDESNDEANDLRLNNPALFAVLEEFREKFETLLNT